MVEEKRINTFLIIECYVGKRLTVCFEETKAEIDKRRKRKSRKDYISSFFDADTLKSLIKIYDKMIELDKTIKWDSFEDMEDNWCDLVEKEGLPTHIDIK